MNPDPERLGGLAWTRRSGGRLTGADFKRELASMMKAEAQAVPGGRFSLLVRCGLPLAIRLAPFND